MLHVLTFGQQQETAQSSRKL